MNPHRLRSVSAILLASLTARAQSAPQDDQQLKELQSLLDIKIISASKVAQKASDAPATVLVITADQIRRRGYRSLLQVLEDLPDYKVEHRSDPEWYNDVTVRGVNGSDTFVILLDGMKITPSTNERIPIMENYPVHLAKQIEIVYGPASALYGADAVSGVINIITKDDTDGIEGALGSNGDGMRLANFHFGKAFRPDVRLTISGQWFYDPLTDLDKDWNDFNGFRYQRAGGPFPNPFVPAFPFAPKVPFTRDPSYPEKTRALYVNLHMGELDFRLFRNSAKVSSSLTYKADNAIADENVFLDQSLTVLGMQHTLQAGSFTAQTSLTASRYDLDPHSNFRNAFSDMEPAYKYAQSSAYKGEEQVTWLTASGITFVGGASYEVLEAIPWSTDLQSPVDTSGAVAGFLRGLPLGTDGQPLRADFFPLKYNNSALYLQAQYEARPGLNLTGGLREDWNSRYGSTFNPRAGVVWHPGDRHTFKVLYGSAFLAPSPLLAYAHFGSFFPVGGGNYASAFWRLPNPQLKPLKEKTLEASYSATLSSNFNASVTVYRTKLTDLHQLEDNGPTVARLYPTQTYKGWPVSVIEVRTNLGEQTNTGGTVQLDYLQSFSAGLRLNVYVAFSRVDGKVDLLGNGHEVDIGLVSPSMARVGAELQGAKWSVSARYLHVGTQRFASRDAAGKPYELDGYGTLNLHALWDITPQWGVFLEGSNLTDSRYRNINHEWDPSTSSGLTEYRGAPQDPRRIGGGVRMRF